MTILRVYKAGEMSWVSPGALLAALQDKDAKLTFVRHHRDAETGLATTKAIIKLRKDFRENKLRAVAVLLWSLVPALLILWPPIFYTMAPEVRGAVWVGAGVCGLIGIMSFIRAVLGFRTTRDIRIEDWVIEDGPTMLPPAIAWREE